MKKAARTPRTARPVIFRLVSPSPWPRWLRGRTWREVLPIPAEIRWCGQAPGVPALASPEACSVSQPNPRRFPSHSVSTARPARCTRIFWLAAAKSFSRKILRWKSALAPRILLRKRRRPAAKFQKRQRIWCQAEVFQRVLTAEFLYHRLDTIVIHRILSAAHGAGRFPLLARAGPHAGSGFPS